MLTRQCLRYFFLLGILCAQPHVAFSQYSHLEKRFEILFNKIGNDTKVYISNKDSLVTITQERASYKIPYYSISCLYLIDSGQMHFGKGMHCVKLKCLKDFKRGDCRLRVKYEDGWRGVSSELIAFYKKEDAYEFIELITLAKRKTIP